MSQKPLKIAMITNNYYPFIGGVPISIDRLSKGLRALGHTVVVFAPQYPGQPLDSDPDVVRCELITYREVDSFPFAITNIFSQKIAREFEERRFDIVHVHHPFWMGTKGLTLSRKYGIPLVFTQHTQYDMYYHYMPVIKGLFKRHFSHRMVLHFAQKCDLIIAPVETSRGYLQGLGVTKPVAIMPTGVEMIPLGSGQALREKLAPNGELLLCTVARLAKEKNLIFLLECVKRVRERCSVPFRSLIIGDGPERGALEDCVRRLDLTDTVILTGGMPPEDVCAYYDASDIFVFTSVSEVQGMSLFEAMAGHVPVVAVSSRGVDDVIIDGVNGYRTAHDAEEWSRQVAELMENAEARRELSKNAFEHARKYSVGRVAERAEELYREAIDKKNAEKKKRRSAPDSGTAGDIRL